MSEHLACDEALSKWREENDRLRTELAAAQSEISYNQMEAYKESKRADAAESKLSAANTRGDQQAALCEKMREALEIISMALDTSALPDKLKALQQQPEALNQTLVDIAKIVNAALAATPASAMAEVRAQAVEDFIESLEDGTHGAMESPDFGAKFSIEQLYARAAALKQH